MGGFIDEVNDRDHPREYGENRLVVYMPPGVRGIIPANTGRIYVSTGVK